MSSNQADPVITRELTLSLRYTNESLAAYRAVSSTDEKAVRDELRKKALAILAIDWEKNSDAWSGDLDPNDTKHQKMKAAAIDVGTKARAASEKRKQRDAAPESQRAALGKELAAREKELVAATDAQWSELENLGRWLVQRDGLGSPPRDLDERKKWINKSFAIGNPVEAGDEECVIYYEQDDGTVVCEHCHPVEGNSFVTVTSDSYPGVTAQLVFLFRLYGLKGSRAAAQG